ncbi:MAG: tetratricopeptide repeat protein [Candidatus Omnitrophica bacterium]|nr:tetratricopeptide repeat protein [Candidatus Omnitrophota bacterium]
MKYIIAILIYSICFLGVNNGFAQSRKDTDRRTENIDVLIRKANELYEEENYVEAKGVYETVVKLQPQNAIAVFYLQLIPEKIKEKAEYEKEQQVYILYHQGLGLYNNKQYQQAQEKFKAVEDILLDYKRTKYYLDKIPSDIEGKKNLKKIQLEEASSLCQQVSVDAAQKAESFLKEAYSLYEDGKFLEAKSFYEEVIELDPENNVALLYLERIPEKMKEQEKFERERQTQNIYKQAVSLYQDSQYSRALEKFKEVEGLAPDYKQTRYFIENLPSNIKKRKHSLNVKDLGEKNLQAKRIGKKYKEAVSLYKKKSYQMALNKFKEITREYPVYKDVASYFNCIDKDIKRDEIQLLLKEAENVLEKENYTEAEIIYQKVLVRDPQNSVALFQLDRIPAKVREKKRRQLIEKAQFVYCQAVTLYKKKQYRGALEQFKEAQILVPKYKNTEKYIQRGLAAIRKAQEQAFAEEVRADYKEAITLYKKKMYLDAINKFKEVNESWPKYEKTEQYIKLIFVELKKDRDDKDENKKMIDATAEGKYKEACFLYNGREHKKALEKFKQLEEFYPNYKDTFIYIHRITKKVQEDRLSSLLKEAEILYEQGHYMDAKSIYKTILEYHPDNKIALVYFDRIESKLQRISSSASNLALLYRQAVSLYEGGKYQSSLKKFEEVKRILPNYEETNYYLSRISQAIFNEREQN